MTAISNRRAWCALPEVCLRAAPEVRDAPRAESRVKDVMAMSEQELLAIVPDQCPDVESACPKCRTYLRTVRKGWKWSPNRPFPIQCPMCATVYPNKDDPMDKTQTFLNFIGEEIAVPYHRGPKPRGDYRGNEHPERLVPQSWVSTFLPFAPRRPVRYRSLHSLEFAG